MGTSSAGIRRGVWHLRGPTATRFAGPHEGTLRLVCTFVHGLPRVLAYRTSVAGSRGRFDRLRCGPGVHRSRVRTPDRLPDAVPSHDQRGPLRGCFLAPCPSVAGYRRVSEERGQGATPQKPCEASRGRGRIASVARTLGWSHTTAQGRQGGVLGARCYVSATACLDHSRAFHRGECEGPLTAHTGRSRPLGFLALFLAPRACPWSVVVSPCDNHVVFL